MLPIPRPSPQSVSPHHLVYLDCVPQEELSEFLEAQTGRIAACLGGLEAAAGHHRYETGKWSLGEVLGHVCDTERIFGYRLLCIARGETQPLPGFDQDAFVLTGAFDGRALPDLLAEFADIRRASLSLLRSLPEGAMERSGVANGRPLSVPTLAYLLAGHAEHHFAVIQSRYLPGKPA